MMQDDGSGRAHRIATAAAQATTWSASTTTATLLEYGLGRAYMVFAGPHTIEDDDALIAACVTDVAWDAQVEGQRAPYLYDLLKVAGLVDRVAPLVRQLLTDACEDSWTLAQRWDLAGCLAKDGHEDLRDAMRQGIVTLADAAIAGSSGPAEDGLSEAADALIRLEGIDGVLLALRQLGRVTAARPDDSVDDFLLVTAREIVGSELDLTLAAARPADAHLDAYLRAVEEQEQARGPVVDPSASVPADWETARRAIASQVRGTGQNGRRWQSWGKRAADVHIQQAARALSELPREDTELLRPYLAIFQHRRYPLDPAPIVQLLDDPRPDVAWLAAGLLACVEDPMVREVALAMADHGPLRERSIDLLAANWMPGDEAIVEQLLGTLQDDWAIHHVAFSLARLLDDRLGAGFVPALLLGYERSPCSNCRHRFVDALIRLEALPDRLRQECRWDANADTRALVAESGAQP